MPQRCLIAKICQMGKSAKLHSQKHLVCSLRLKISNFMERANATEAQWPDDAILRKIDVTRQMIPRGHSPVFIKANVYVKLVKEKEGMVMKAAAIAATA